jgi:GDP-L-fucose synthase
VKKDARIYIAEHTGMVGSALVKLLEQEGYTSLITCEHAELDLTDTEATNAFFVLQSLNMCSLPQEKLEAF